MEQDGDEDAVHIMVGEVDFLDADERDDTNPEIILHEKNLDNESSEEKEVIDAAKFFKFADTPLYPRVLLHRSGFWIGV